MRSIPEQIIDEVFASLHPPIEKAIGRRETYANAGAPRVVAIPLGAPVIEQPDRHGAQHFTEHGKKIAKRILLLRRFVIDWECHATSRDELTPSFGASERLYLAVLISLRRACHHSVSFSGERWVSQEDNADGFVMYGSTILFTSTIDIPVWDAPQPLVTPAEVITTYKLNNEIVGDE